MRATIPRKAKITIDYSEVTRKTNSLKLKSQINNKSVEMAEAKISLDTLINAFPTFDGKKNANIKNFVEQYENLVTEAKIPESLQVILLKGKIIGQARDTVYDNEDINSETDFTKFKEKLLEIFKKESTFEQSQAAFMDLKQMPTQSIDDYVKKFNSAASNYLKKSGCADKEGAKQFLQNLKMSKFIDTIRPDIALEVRKQGPANFEEALKISKQIEIAFQSENKETVNAINANENKKDIYEVILALAKKQDEELNTLKAEFKACKLQDNKQKSNQKEIKYCEICKIKGHTLEECWYNIKDKNKKQQQAKDSGYNDSKVGTEPMLVPMTAPMFPQAGPYFQSNIPFYPNNYLGQPFASSNFASANNQWQNNVNMPGTSYGNSPNFQNLQNQPFPNNNSYYAQRQNSRRNFRDNFNRNYRGNNNKSSTRGNNYYKEN